MSGHNRINGPAFAILDHFFMALIEKDALGRSVGHSSKNRRERAEDQAAWREFAAGRGSSGCRQG
jgi:hypothetical protein